MHVHNGSVTRVTVPCVIVSLPVSCMRQVQMRRRKTNTNSRFVDSFCIWWLKLMPHHHPVSAYYLFVYRMCLCKMSCTHTHTIHRVQLFTLSGMQRCRFFSRLSIDQFSKWSSIHIFHSSTMYGFKYDCNEP